MGFPNRIARSSLGPKLENKWPVVNPKNDIGADQFNLLFHQAAGMNLVSARGLLFVDVNTATGTITTLYQGIAWDPDGLLPKIVWNRTSAGVYLWSLPQASYPDEANNQIEVEILGGLPIPQELSNGNLVSGQNEKTGVRSGTVRFRETGGPCDSDFLFLFW